LLFEIIQIVPQLPPVINGLGDYAFNLACQLRQDFGIDTQFIVCNSKWEGNYELDGFKIRYLKNELANELAKMLNDHSIVLIHYSGYGYSKKGIPYWLFKGLNYWKYNNSSHKLVTSFHEVYATSSPLKSAFWLSYIQKYIASKIAQISDFCYLSLGSHIKWLMKYSSCPILTLPVFSNVGELKENKLFSERKKQLVVFGTYGRRLPVYQKSKHLVDKVAKELGIYEIIDIGKILPAEVTNAIKLPVNVMGEKSYTEIHTILSNSIAGVIDYPSSILAKSGIFAAYCAHSMLPIVVGSKPNEKEIDCLKSNINYCIPQEDFTPMRLNIAQDIADNAYSWYQNHNLRVHSDSFYNKLIELLH